MGEIKPLADALAIWAEEGRVNESDINGESSLRRYQPLVSEWSNPLRRNAKRRCRKIPSGTLGTETSKYQVEKKSS